MAAPRRPRRSRAAPLPAETWRLSRAETGYPRLAVCYPSSYRVGMANLGFHALLELALGAGATVERAFLPDEEQIVEHRRSGAPLVGLDGGRPLGRCDALLFSVAFEPDYLGLVQMLELAGLPPLAAERADDAPLVVAGGLAPSLNPEPIAPCCDLIGIGEAEVLLPPLLALLRERSTRRDLVERASALPGWYAPALGPGRTERQHAPLGRPCLPVVLSAATAFARHVDLEISRGCRWRCRFCAAGQVVAPYRELPLAALEEALDWSLGQRRRIGLVGTDVSDHGHLWSIVEAIRRRGGEPALPSLRAESLSRRESAASRVIRTCPPRSLTLAVESASESLRAAVGKRLSDEQLRRAVRLAAEAGVHQLRLYFLVGVPGERWSEVEGIAALATELQALGPPGGLALSVSGLVPKAGTPLQWEAAPDRDYLRRARERLRQLLRGTRVELHFESPDWTRWEAHLSLAGREAAAHLLAAARGGWRRELMRLTGETPHLGGRGRWPSGALPWAHIAHGGCSELLRQERERCLAREYVPPTRLESDPHDL